MTGTVQVACGMADPSPARTAEIVADPMAKYGLNAEGIPAA
ncbi:hypothetical protein [Streptomyces sp. NPDC093970]